MMGGKIKTIIEFLSTRDAAIEGEMPIIMDRNDEIVFTWGETKRPWFDYSWNGIDLTVLRKLNDDAGKKSVTKTVLTFDFLRWNTFPHIVESNPNLRWLIITPNPLKIVDFINQLKPSVQKNISIGMLVKRQSQWNFSVPMLQAVKKVTNVKTFVMMGPLEGPIDINRVIDCWDNKPDWLIISGGSRPCKIAWIRTILMEATFPIANTITPMPLVYVDQLGSYLAKELGVPDAGDNPTKWPSIISDLRIREIPVFS